MANNVNQYMINVELDKLYCIDMDDLSMGGSWDNEFLNYVEFDIYTRAVKFTMDVVQVSSNRMDNIQMDNTERYLYLHQF